MGLNSARAGHKTLYDVAARTADAYEWLLVNLGG